LIPEGEKAHIRECWVERNLEKYKAEDDNQDIAQFTRLIYWGLLHTQVPPAYDHAPPVHTDPLQAWSSLGNLALDAVPARPYHAALFGVAVGDALGVPVEFAPRTSRKTDPVRDMRGFGTYQQPAGTWSDDSSLTFCLADTLSRGLGPEDLAQRCLGWFHHNLWTARGQIFDIGNGTRKALHKIAGGIAPQLAGGDEASDNGNGALMRILPLVFLLR